MTHPDHPDLPAAAATLASELRSFMGQFRRRLWEQSDSGDLTPSQIATILRLETMGAATTSDLAREEGMRPQSMGAIVAALETAGFVEGAPDPDDGRKTLLTLTETCREWLRVGRATRQDWLLRTIDARLSADERDQVLAAMPLLHRLVEK